MYAPSLRPLYRHLWYESVLVVLVGCGGALTGFAMLFASNILSRTLRISRRLLGVVVGGARVLRRLLEVKGSRLMRKKEEGGN
jgi:hypothetical protein